MTVLTDGRHTAEYIASEANGTRSREVVTLSSGNNLVAGTVLAKITTGGNAGEFTVLNPGSLADPADGTKVAAAILFDSVNATAADKPAVITARDTEVKAVALTWPAGISGPEKTAALAQLAALGIVAR